MRQSFGTLFIISLCLLFVFQLVVPKKLVSQRENRALTQAPELTLTSFLSHSFSTSLEQYQSDHFPMRESMSTLANRFQQMLGRKQVQEVLLGKQSELYQMPAPYEHGKSKQLADYLTSFHERYTELPIFFLLVPNKLAIIDQLAPSFVDTSEQLAQIQDFYQALPSFVKTMDIASLLAAHKEEYIYYHGDHHWTSKGAYLVAKAYLSSEGIKDTSTYQEVIANDAFYGTLANATGFSLRDTITLYQREQEELAVLVNYVEEQKKSTSIYAIDKQYSTNPYELFLDGNHAQVEITTSSLEDRSLLVFKDSYANCFLPFLLPYYHRIVVIDPRYYYGDIASLLKQYDIDEVLCLYNANTLFADSALLHLFQEEFTQ